MEKRLRRNIPKLYIYAFFQMFLVIIPVLVPFFQKKGLTLQDVFVLQGIFGAALIVFDAPAGYLADYFGRKRALIVGSIVSAIGFQILWFGQSFLHFAIYELILGLGLSLQSGCDVAILYNTLEKLEPYDSAQGKIAKRRASFLGRRLMAATLGEGFAALLGGFLAGFSLELPAYANALTAVVPILAASLLYEPDGLRLPRGSHFQNFRSIGKALFGHSRLLTLVIASFIFYGFATFCAVWSLQPYWKSRGLDYTMFGYLWAANNFAVALVGRYAHAIEERIGSTKSILLIACLPVIGYLGMGFSAGLIGLVFCLAFPVCRGLNQVLFQDAINTRVPPEMRATTNSVGSLGMRALFVVFGPFLGYVFDTRGPDAAMKGLGFVYVIGFFLIALPLLSQLRHFRTGV
jgi:MFS family permease